MVLVSDISVQFQFSLFISDKNYRNRSDILGYWSGSSFRYFGSVPVWFFVSGYFVQTVMRVMIKKSTNCEPL